MNRKSNPTDDVERRVRAAFTASESITQDWAARPLSQSARQLDATTDEGETLRQRWQAPLLAAAAVAAMVVATVLIVRHPGPSATPAAAPPTSSHTSPAPSANSPTTPEASPTASTLGPVTPVTLAPGRTAQSGPANPKIGVVYPFDLFTHCGIRVTIFGGRNWEAVHPQGDPQRLPDSDGMVTYNGYVGASAILVTESELRITLTDPLAGNRDQSFVFTPAKSPIPLCA